MIVVIVILGLSNLIAIGLYHRQREEVARMRRMFRITRYPETRANQ